MSAFSPALLALVATPDYVPQPPEALAQRLRVPPAELPAFLAEVDALLRSGRLIAIKKGRLALPADADLVVGTIRFRQNGSADINLDPVPGGRPPPPIPVRAEDTSTAFHGDRVIARRVEARRRARYGRRAPGKAAPIDERETARVIRILERARTVVTGTLQRSKAAWYVIPDDPRIVQDILVPDPATTGIKPVPGVGDKVVVRLADWKERHLNPEGEIERSLGRSHTPRAEYEALLVRHQLEAGFPADVEAEAARFPDKVPASDLAGRIDLRQKLVFTIDPDDAKDFDDALSIEREGDDLWRVGIHIADASHYVRPGTALDREARRRGNSTYLVGTVLPMLPHSLSDGLCSLVEAQDRLTRSVFLTIGKEARILKTEFGPSVIRSRKRLTYKQAYALLKEDDLGKVRALPPPAAHETGSTGRPLAEVPLPELKVLQQAIRDLWSIAERFRHRRFAQGSLDLEMPEVKIRVDPEGRADVIERILHDESHQLVEEFMLAANEAVARHLLGKRRVLLHRVHDEPDPEKLADLPAQLEPFGIKPGDLSNRDHVTRFLGKLRDHPQAHVLRVMFLRSLRQACYRATPDGHYGLAKKFYTHFTSPIRRYSDLVVHRVLALDDAAPAPVAVAAPAATPSATPSARPGERPKGRDTRRGRSQPTSAATSAAPAATAGLSLAELTEVATHLSRTEQNSTEAERESVKIKLVEFFERELDRTPRRAFDAAVLEVRNHGLMVELTESLAFGFVHTSTLDDDFYVLEDDGTALVGRRTRRRIQTGTIIQVAIDRVDRYKRQLDFRLAGSPEASPQGKEPSAHPGNRPAKSHARPASKPKDHRGRAKGRTPRGRGKA